jgi:hypothetical protein
LLTFRGWAMHDRQITLFGDLPLPARSDAWWAPRGRQEHAADPSRELDGRAGYYARVEWKMEAPIAIDLMHYDNAGDRESVENGQTAWETRFTNIGLRARVADDTHILAQAMTGQTIWVRMANGPVPFLDDVDFASAYVMLDHTFGTQGVAARIDAFRTRDNQSFNINSTPENGWALTAAWRNAIGGGLSVVVEGVYMDSDRSERAQVGVDPQQDQVQVQSSLRWEF